MLYSIDNLFPTPIYVSSNHHNMCQILRNQAINLDPNKWIVNNTNNPEDYYASDNHVLSEPNNKGINSIIVKHVNTFVCDILHYDIPDGCYFDIVDSWFTKTNKDIDTVWHNHSFAMICGILCLDNIGWTEFRTKYKHKFFDFDIKEANHYTSGTYNIPSKQGTLLLWEAELEHRAVTDDLRYSLAFNVIPKGNLSNRITSRLSI